jgi:hexosaminidase
MEKQGIRHVEDLQGYFMSRVGQIIQSKGKKMIGWDEILEGGITPGAAVMSWRGVKGGIQAAKMGHEVVMTPTTHAYIDYNQGEQTIDPPIYSGLRVSKSYSFEPVPDGVEAKYILGGQANLWTEQIPTLRYAEYMTYPRAWALAEVYWSPKEAKNWNSFSSRMEKHFQRSDAAGVNYSRAVYDPAVKTRKENGQLLLVLESEINGVDIHYTLDETMPDNYSPKYASPVPVPDGPVNLRVQAYRNGVPCGHLITLKRSQLEARAQ